MVEHDAMEVDGVDSAPSLDGQMDLDVDLDEDGNPKSKYQKENVFIHLLPYSDALEKETADLLDHTLLYISKCVMARDLHSGFSLYTKSLGAFIDMYGRKFTKEQHIKLIELMMEVLVMETLPLTIVHDVAELLQTLLRKQELLTREDLVFSWRPLYETLDRWVYHRKYSLSYTANAKLETSLKETIRLCNLYFPKESLPEIIAEFTPMLCPSSVKMSFGLEMLKYFLPFQNSECEEQLSEFVKLLLSFHDSWNNHPVWEWSMMNLLSTAAWNMTGKFDWEPYLATMYARLMRNLDLPVYFKNAKSSGTIVSCKTYECGSTARWIVATLGRSPSALTYLKTFMKSLETYYNPNNAGRWTHTLANLLRDLAENFTRRVKRERYLEKKRWWSKTPEDKKLTEDDIESFVDVLAGLALDFYLDLALGGYVLKSLAVLRPQTIIPAVMEKYSGMVETLTESKKYMTTMRWVMVLINMMVSGRKDDEGYDGRHLIIPFLNSLLPAIDPNDMHKTLTALSCLCIVVSYINLVDCSSQAENIEDEEKREICFGTAGFDDFVLQLLDRVFTLIENRAHENTRMADSRQVNTVNVEDISLQKIIWAVFRPLATHSSTAICKIAVDKIVSFAFSNTLETDVSGRLFASICQAYAVSRPDIILPKLLPRLCTSVQQHVTDDILDDEDLDKTLLFHMLLLSYIMETIGTELVKYRKDVEAMLSAVLKLNGKKGYTTASVIFMRLLNSLVFIYPLENKLSDVDFDDPNYLAFDDWGKYCHWKDTKITWHTPSVEELTWAKDIFLEKFLQFSKLFENISQLPEGNEELNKKLLKGMQILQSSYDGISIILPFWNDTPIVVLDSIADFSPDPYTFGYPDVEIVVPGTGENIKKKYFDMFTEIQAYLEKFKADDTDAFVSVIRGLDSLIVPCIEAGCRYAVATKPKNMPVAIPAELSSLNPKKRHIRVRSVVRVYSLHLKRVRAAVCSSWTESHLEILHKLFTLCVNRYAKVRCIAQQRFCRYIDWSSGFLCRYVTGFILEKLEAGIPHHEYKGVLYVLQSSKCSPVLLNSWEELSRIWMALLKSPFSEKNSIIVCMHHIQHLIARDFVFFPFEDRVPKTSRLDQLAKELVREPQWRNEIEGKVQPFNTSKNIVFYNKLIDGLLEFGPKSNCHWRKQQMAAEMLSVLVVEEVPVRAEVVDFFFCSLISKYIDIQRIGLTSVPWILSIFKRQYKPFILDTTTGIKFAEGETARSILQYKSKSVQGTYSLEFDESPSSILNQAEIEAPPTEFTVHKIHYGFTSLPLKMEIKVCPTDFRNLSDQKAGTVTALSTCFKYLDDEEYLKKLMELWSIEEKTKGVDSKRASFAKLIARNCGPEALVLLIRLLEPMSNVKDQWKQRLVSNMFGGIFYGMKLWSNEKIEMFWTGHLKPIFLECLNNVTQETFDFWVNAISLPVNNRDGNKLRFFIQCLQERFMNSLETAQTTSVDAHNDMAFFQRAIQNLQWRGGDLYMEILAGLSKYFLETPIPYRNVRGQLGTLLAHVWEWNIESLQEFGIDLSGQCKQFLVHVLDTLKDVVPVSTKFQANDAESEENLETRNLLLKFKTVLEWINCVCWDVESTIHSKFYCFIPWLCYFESYDPDPEVAQLSTVALAGLSKHLISPQHMDQLLDSLNEAANSTSWKARLSVLEFLKVFAISNASIIVSSEVWSDRVINLVLKLLGERKLEVRELASRILCGFLHCLLVPHPMELLKKFKKESEIIMKKRKSKKSKGDTELGLTLTPEEIDRAHSAILGICAFVDTHPYDVPEYLPDILIYLTTHLNDCQPIPATIRKCLSNFRRTHHDNWAVHKLKFSEDQLCTLTDIFVSPCYYA